MQKKTLFVTLTALFILATLTGCSGSLFSTPTPTNTPLPTSTPLPTDTPTATPVPYFVDATVMSGVVQAPIILYHRFANDTHAATSTYTRYSDLKAELQKLYDAGFSIVSLSSWLDGTWTVPAGRKPLIFTLDDGIYADQLYINDDGTPSSYSGLGILYAFSQEHPDFGFSASIFCNMGDKYYGDLFVNDWFYVSDGDKWKTKLANTMVWALEHNIDLYNHTYTHVELSLTDNAGIAYQLSQNDKVMRQFLALANRSDLDAKLGNIIALPYGIWPATPDGVLLLKNYTNPEGKPLAAIMEAYNADEPTFTPSTFSANYDRMKLPRITSTVGSIDWISQNSGLIPTAQSCQLGPTTEAESKDAATIQNLISSAVQSGTCPEGIYWVNGQIYLAQNGTASPYTAGMTLNITPTATLPATATAAQPTETAVTATSAVTETATFEGTPQASTTGTPALTPEVTPTTAP